MPALCVCVSRSHASARCALVLWRVESVSGVLDQLVWGGSCWRMENLRREGRSGRSRCAWVERSTPGGSRGVGREKPSKGEARGGLRSAQARARPLSRVSCSTPGYLGTWPGVFQPTESMTRDSGYSGINLNTCLSRYPQGT
eukprot:3850526-Rhodomonas_salina.2